MELPGHLELAPAWRDIRAELRRVVGDSTFDMWLAPLEVSSWEAGTLVLEAPAPTQAWISRRFGGVLGSAVRSVLGSQARVSFDGPPRARRNATTSEQAAALDLPTGALNPRYTFDQFIIGDGNRLAHAAALAVAELPGQAYNPLFLHAAPGLGKTHLLHAIGNYAVAFGAGSTIRYTTVEAFTNRFINALHSRSLERFKRAYRDVDVLLIDDVQFLASKAKTEEEFFHTFNTLYETGRQLVLTCDRLPHQLVAIEERLRERFESGLVADIRPPDFATRVAILSKRAVLDEVPLVDGSVLELVADRIADNVRSLEGALIRIVAFHSLTGRPIDTHLAADVLDEISPRRRQRRALSIADVQGTVADYYGISVPELNSASRTARIVWPRQVAIHLTRALTDVSLNEIGDAFGGRTHATIMHACKRVSDRIRDDEDAAAAVEELHGVIGDRAVDRAC